MTQHPVAPRCVSVAPKGDAPQSHSFPSAATRPARRCAYVIYNPACSSPLQNACSETRRNHPFRQRPPASGYVHCRHRIVARGSREQLEAKTSNWLACGNRMLEVAWARVDAAPRSTPWCQRGAQRGRSAEPRAARCNGWEARKRGVMAVMVLYRAYVLLKIWREKIGEKHFSPISGAR